MWQQARTNMAALRMSSIHDSCTTWFPCSASISFILSISSLNFCLGRSTQPSHSEIKEKSSWELWLVFRWLSQSKSIERWLSKHRQANKLLKKLRYQATKIKIHLHRRWFRPKTSFNRKNWRRSQNKKKLRKWFRINHSSENLASTLTRGSRMTPLRH